MRWITATALLCSVVLSDGQGPVAPGPIVIGDLRLGEYWYGAQLDKRDLIGKVVLVETWGS